MPDNKNGEVKFTRADAENITKTAVKQEQTHEIVLKMDQTLTDFVTSANNVHRTMNIAIEKNTNFRTITCKILGWLVGVISSGAVITAVLRAFNIV